MKTIIQTMDRKSLNAKDFETAIQLLKEGQLVAFPTETVYGLGGNALDETAAKRIYEAKGRPSDNPLIVHIADIKDLEKLAVDIPEAAYQLANAFWPGPLTMILKKSEIVPLSTSGGLNTVGIRMPSDPIASMLIKESGLYIAAPSANSSGRPSTTKAEHVIEDLSGKISMIIDGGAVDIGLESTIVDLSGEKALILRPGFITREQLMDVIGDVDYDKAVLKREANPNIVAKAPGMKYKHYAPKGELTIYEGDMDKVIAKINEQAREKVLAGESVAILATDETKDHYHNGIVKSIGSRCDEKAIASHLFDVLREFDTLGISYIYSESFADNNLGQAIMNRLLKAAGYHIITV
ncbi:L-threonylcarbamoyladenylate synthase [Clostridium sp. Marseille-P299]|uniref:L-threonylcarbamoyladenylate synthase n=1 Tax=Clostridium sp. Marseille-P299 TaxID=1805477 RepID=UPI000A5CEBCF|nr:L-threonylcarbamoyladenylate synthase [Clostridium sp. Marseille-P299]